jgi:hypothetical protein
VTPTAIRREEKGAAIALDAPAISPVASVAAPNIASRRVKIRLVIAPFLPGSV